MRLKILIVLVFAAVLIGYPLRGAAREEVPATGVRLDQTSLIMVRYTTAELTATVYSRDATNRAVMWVSSDEKIVEVKHLGGASAGLKALAPGTAVVTVITADGGWRASCRVEVIILVEHVAVELSEITLAPSGELALRAWVEPRDATDQRLFWQSSDSSVVIVDEDGLVTAKKAGQARVVARSVENEDIYDYCTVVVSQAAAADDPDRQQQEESERAAGTGETAGPATETAIDNLYLYIGLGAAGVIIIILLAMIIRRGNGSAMKKRSDRHGNG